MKKAIVFSCILLIIVQCVLGQNKNLYPFENPSLSFDERAADIVSRLTLREKMDQLFNGAPAIERLSIPAYNWWNESLHGVARAGKATVFPQAIGLAASFNESLMFSIADAISDEARAKHNFFISHNVRSIYTGLDFWSPNINIFRDPRWGRGQETYGEDPFLTARMAVNFIRGLQGNDPKYLKTIATAKHYAVHSGPEFSRHTDNVFVNDHDLFDTYLPAFKAAVQEGHVQSVMCAYNRFRDQPCCGSNLLLSNILRDQFGFTGYIVSDCGAITDFYNPAAHHLVTTPARAWGWSLNTGTDINCEESKAFMPDNIDSAVHNGIINERNINVSLKRLFKARLMLGMFDPQDAVVYNKIPMAVVGNVTHKKLALQAAEEAIVLLKNNGTLPLKKDTRVALIGPNANYMPVLLGNYNGLPVDPVTPLKALQQSLGAKNVLYAPGCPIVKGVYTGYDYISGDQLFHKEDGKLKKGLQAAYFSNTMMTGDATLQRIDTAIAFHWQTSPLNNKVEDQFSVKWKGLLVPKKSGRYMFSGNVKLMINHRKVADTAIELVAGKEYALEATLTVEPFWWANTIEPAAEMLWVNTTVDYEKQALDAAAKSDIIIFCGGISPQLEGEEMPLEINGFSHGDRTHIELPDVQENLLKKLAATGKKIVYVNFSGSAVALNWEAENMDAILQAFYPGEATGTALTNILFGATNPSGRLPVTFYRFVDDLPAFKDYSMKGRTYRYFKGNPLYPFGFGLSYTTYGYSNFNLPQEVSCGDSIRISVDVTNTGAMDGDEVTEIFVSHHDSSVLTPVIALAGIKKAMLKKGERQRLSFVIAPEQLAVVQNDGSRLLQPGLIDVFAGSNLPDKKGIEQRSVIKANIRLTGKEVTIPFGKF